jgi:uncharacterized protein (TIGR01777 family)
VYKILVTGASGFIGSAVTSYFKQQGYIVAALVRKKGQDGIFWNPDSEEIHLDELEGLEAVIHLAGKNVFQKRWSKRAKEEIFLSRVRSTWLLSHAFLRLKRPPKLFFSASATGYYGDRKDELLTEASRKGRGFLADVCQKWEEASLVLKESKTRLVQARFGGVLSPDGGMLKQLNGLFKWGLGMKFGTGQQWISWIALSDLVRAIDFCLSNKETSGVYNFTAPNPVTHDELTKAVARHLHRPRLFTIPIWAAHLLGGQRIDELLLASTRALPERLLKSGFVFEKPYLQDVLPL